MSRYRQISNKHWKVFKIVIFYTYGYKGKKGISMFAYADYLKQHDSLSFEKALEIYNAIFMVFESDDEYLHEL